MPPACAALNTLDISNCCLVKDVSGLVGCAELERLDISWCHGLTDHSKLAGCAALSRLIAKGVPGDRLPHKEGLEIVYD